jgi:hypothetical protein
MATEKALADAKLVLLPEDWEGEVDPGSSSDLMFVVQLEDGEPVRLAKLSEVQHAGQVKEGLEEGEPLRPAQVELPEGRVLNISYGRQGALWREGGRHVLLPAKRSFEGPEEVAAILAQPHYLAITGEQLPGRAEPFTRRRSVLRECPGPPPHLITLPPGESGCPSHGVQTEPA